jgi:hypothetical protein
MPVMFTCGETKVALILGLADPVTRTHESVHVSDELVRAIPRMLSASTRLVSVTSPLVSATS